MLLTLDFETYWSSEHSLSKLTTAEYILSPQFQTILVGAKIDNQPSRWFADEDVEKFLRSIDWRQVALLCHHTRFDGAILAWRYGLRPAVYLDTMAMAQARLFADTGSAGLSTLAQRTMLGVKGVEVMNVKGFRRENFSPEGLARYGDYCANDVDITHRLWELMKPTMPASEIFLIDHLIRGYIDPVLSLDQPALLAHLVAVQAQQANLLEVLGITPEDCRSDAKFAVLLEQCGIDPPMKISPTTGQPTYAFAKTDEEFTALLEDDDPTIAALVAARLGTKTTIEESRTQRLLSVARLHNNLLPVPLKYYGAHTGRLSGTDKINLQNIGRKSPLRKCITARYGEMLVSADASQIEARILAWLAGEWDLVNAFADGRDVYVEFAKRLYGREVSKPSTERQVGKTGVLGCGYGCGPPRFQGMLRINKVQMDLAGASAVVAAYRSGYPRIPGLWKFFNNVLLKMCEMQPGQRELIELHPHWRGLGCWITCDSVQLPNGMHLMYRELRRDADNEMTYRFGKHRKKIYGAKLVENYVQALARIVVLDKIHVLKQSAPWARFALTIHDSLIFATPETRGQEFYQLLLEEMARPPAWGPGIPLASEGGVGWTLAEAEGKN